MPGQNLLARLALAALLAGASGHGLAQNAQSDGAAAARIGEIAHAQKMRKLFPEPETATQVAPPVIPALEIDTDPSGAIGSFQPNGPTTTAKNAFFQNLGSSGRTCFTCHQPKDAWSGP